MYDAFNTIISPADIFEDEPQDYDSPARVLHDNEIDEWIERRLVESGNLEG